MSDGPRRVKGTDVRDTRSSLAHTVTSLANSPSVPVSHEGTECERSEPRGTQREGSCLIT